MDVPEVLYKGRMQGGVIVRGILPCARAAIFARVDVSPDRALLMRTVFWVLGVAVLLVPEIVAQDWSPFALQRKGLRVGLVGTTFTGADAEQVSMQTSIAAGGFVVVGLQRLPLGELGLQLELLYTRRGVEQEIQLGGGGYTLRYDLAYLELPVLLRLAVPVGTYALIPALGVAPAVRLSGKLEQAIPNSVPKPVSASFHGADLGIVAGVGSEFRLRRSARLLLELRLQMGTGSVLKEELKPPLREDKPLRHLRILALGVFAGIGF